MKDEICSRRTIIQFEIGEEEPRQHSAAYSTVDARLQHLCIRYRSGEISRLDFLWSCSYNLQLQRSKQKNVFFSFFWISIESMQQTDKQFFTLADYKFHALCVNKHFPVQPLPLIILPFGFEESYSAGRPLSRTCEHFHPENIFPIPRQLMVWRACVLPEYWRLLSFYHKRALNRLTEGSGLAQSAACLSGRQSHFNKLQYAYDLHKWLTLKKWLTITI